jgi:hypothetical protein
MAQYEIKELEIWTRVAEHIERRDIAPEDIRSLFDGDHLIGRNRTGREASHMLLGIDHCGRCLAVPMYATYLLGVWCATTAWPCKDGERTTLQHHSEKDWATEQQGNRIPSMDIDDEIVQRTLDEIERELQDPDQWDWDHPVAVTVSPDLKIELGTSFNREELHLLSAAAEAANMPVTRYIKQAALEKAQRAGD